MKYRTLSTPVDDRTPYLCLARYQQETDGDELPHDHQEPGLECRCYVVTEEIGFDDFCECEHWPNCDIMGCTPINPDGPPGYRG